MKRRLLILAMALVSVIAFSGCTITKNLNVVVTRPPRDYFSDIKNGLTVRVQLSPTEELAWFIPTTTEYVRSMGFKEMSSNTAYNLIITIYNRELVEASNSVALHMGVSLKDERGSDLFTQTGIFSMVSFKNNTTSIQNAINEAYTQALEQINWNRIASFLRTEQLPKNEPNKQVQGLGDTALEQTIIRWDIQSRPQGADIFWRVVSKTPEVKSTNNKYLMTTPYEATKALDIKGLTYQTSGNVRIILRCEKDGYMSQEKEFDVRMVLDQEEISAFFRLVKDE